MRFVDIENRRPGGLWWRIPTVLLIWAALISPLVAGYIAVKTLRGYAADLPEVPRLDHWRAEIPQSSRIVASDGSLLALLPFTDGVLIGHREWASFAEMPPLLVRAFLAAEDSRFFSHKGVDPQAVVRAALANYRAGEVVEGASTITQQLARNLLPDGIGDERSVRRKVREALVAYKFEKQYSKTEIFEAYVNLIFFGEQSYGVRAAAFRYFNKELAELNLAESALIAGLAQAPGRADPTQNGEAALARRNEVIARMKVQGFVTASEHDAAIASPIELVEATEVYGSLAPWHTEHVRQVLENEHTELYHRGGLVVETTARPALSIEAIARGRRGALSLGEGKMKGSTAEPALAQVAALVWDYRTAYFEAVVGGRDFSETVFNRATQACRQPGSAFKPILYAAALEADAITPATALRDGPIAEWDEDLGVHWKPQNSGRTFRGVAIAQDALASSLNAPAVDVFDRVGGKALIRFAHRLGIATKLVDVRPLALGASCVIPIQLARAIATIASRGASIDPVWIKQIRRGAVVVVDNGADVDAMLTPERRLDRVVSAAAAPGHDVILDEETAFMTTSMLRDVVRRGTATAARNIGRPVAGKTGTTNQNSDAWFVGFSDRRVAVAWVGYDNPAIRMPPSADGARAALPIWISLMKMAEGARPSVDVVGEPPTGLVRARIDRETGMLAETGAGGAIDLYLRRGTVPTDTAGTRPDLPSSLDRVTREF